MANPGNMVVSFEITFISASDPKLYYFILFIYLLQHLYSDSFTITWIRGSI